MNFLDVFAQLLSEKINKKLLPCKGILRFAFMDANLNLDSSKYDDYKIVFNQYLKERLIRIGIENADEIVKSMISELINNQSLFVMAS
ncbi:MAG: hypothetical protein ACFFAS_18335 [Promethearchaeota archaeon]